LIQSKDICCFVAYMNLPILLLGNIYLILLFYMHALQKSVGIFSITPMGFELILLIYNGI